MKPFVYEKDVLLLRMRSAHTMKTIAFFVLFVDLRPIFYVSCPAPDKQLKLLMNVQ